MIVYSAKCIFTGSIYIGKSIRGLEERRKEHEYDSFIRDSQLYFHRALRKYGSDSFDWQVIDQAKTEQELNEKEKYWIQFYRSFDPAFGYNETFGGDGKSKPCSEIAKRKISEKAKGRPSPFKGTKKSVSTKEKMSLANKKKWADKDIRARMTNWVRDDEMRKKVSLANKGKKLSQETRMKISISGRLARSKEDKDVVC